jgi:hypothetical protein
MARLGAFLLPFLVVLSFGTTSLSAVAQEPSDGAAVVQDPSAIVDPTATVVGTPTPEPTAPPGATATPEPTATATPAPTATPGPSEPVPRLSTSRDFITPGFGSAAQRVNSVKKQERAQDCETAERPPTSHMLGVPGVVPGESGGSWIPVALAVVVGAALFAGTAFALRKGGGGNAVPGPLEGIATLVAICGGLATLAGQFVPGAGVSTRPPAQATIAIRDIKPRITLEEYAHRMRVDVSRRSVVDRAEVGNVIWLQLTLKGFKGRPLSLQYGTYDVAAGEVLLPGTDRSIDLESPKHDVQTTFLPIWVGYPKRGRFTAEFRLIDQDGVQQFASTPPMKASPFRYACGRQG